MDIHKKATEYIENPKSAWKQHFTCVESVIQAYEEGYKQALKDIKEHFQNVDKVLSKVEEFLK